MKHTNIHWYDGWFYEKFISKHVDKYSGQILSFIEADKNVLDAGCGTGRLTFQLAQKSRIVTGIDLSHKNIGIAKEKLAAYGISNITFVCADVLKYAAATTGKYDYTILSFVLHEMPAEMRIPLIEQVKRKSDKIIFADYSYPEAKGLTCLFNRLVEFFAGKDHYNGYKSYINNKGLNSLIELTGLKIISEIKDAKNGRHIVYTTNAN